MLLSLGYGCGLRAGEVVRLKVKHIDSAQKIIRVEQSKGRKDRNVMLSPETLGLLRQWWKARRSRYDAATPVAERWLFPGNRRGKLPGASACCSQKSHIRGFGIAESSSVTTGTSSPRSASAN